jgi:hypothetical protein
MAQTCEGPPRGGSADGPGKSSCLEGIDSSAIAPKTAPSQAEISRDPRAVREARDDAGMAHSVKMGALRYRAAVVTVMSLPSSKGRHDRTRQKRWPRRSVLDRRGRTHAQGRCAVSAEYERATIRAEWPAEFDDGARCGFLGRLESPREPGGYPLGFHGWPLARRNAWFAGFNKGNCDRTILQKEMAQSD